MAGTLVQTPSGPKPIEEICVGDWVFSRDEQFKGEVITRRQVLETYQFENKATLSLTLTSANRQSETLTTTAEHPFVVGSAWVAAQDLRPGDQISTQDGGLATVTEVTDNEMTNPPGS